MQLTTVTEEDMALAMKKALKKRGIPESEVEAMATTVMSFFGFDDSIVDNKLSAKDRDLFYMLEEEGLLKTASDEAQLKKGKIWRIHYWILNKDRIRELIEGEKKPAPAKAKEDVYASLTDEEWAQHRDKKT